MSDPNILTELPDDGRRGPRLEIDEFLQDNEMTNLFLIAFLNLHKDSVKKTDQGQPNWMNFHAIAGIHGQPVEEWAGVKQWKASGYCHHQLNTFPTWHRPYMCLLELALYKEMDRVAGQYDSNSDQKVYRDAAARFRLPYWDLIMPRKELERGARLDTVWAFPHIFKAPQVFVKLPKRTSTTDADGWTSIDNPLWSYRFPSKADYQSSGRRAVVMNANFNNVQTARIPLDDGATNDQYCDLAVQRQAVARATMIWQMLNPDITDQDITGRAAGTPVKVNDFRSWEQFANRGWKNQIQIDDGRTFTMPSLESWHDGIHVLLGTGQYYDPTKRFNQGSGSPGVRRAGQMGDPAFAAFDPVFFFHHCNIDRLLSLHQALFPDKYCNQDDIDTPLVPFLTGDKSPGSQFYKSSNPLVKDYWRAGFATPGNIDPGKVVNQAKVRTELKKYLTDTYYWATNNSSPKDTLPNWPKPLKASWALFGPKAEAIAKPVAQRTSMKIHSGVPAIFAQEITLAPIAMVAQAAQQVLPTEPQLHEMAIETKGVLELADTVNSLLPAGALIDVDDPNKLTVQITWNAKVKVKKYAFDGSFSVHLFTGYVKDDQPERYMTKKNEVGFAGIFARSAADIENCSNCQSQRDNDIVIEDIVPITTIFYDYLESDPHSHDLIREGEHKTIPDLTPESVVPFLTEQLHWRIIDLGATLLSGQERQAGLEITVSSRQYTPPTAENIMGVYGPETVYPEITNSKPGGFGYVYDG
ncbi:hypothetical protein AC579_9209 [Pseudocercospora musae]|uniref:tyrosinase n=1 Tax=Pseudocercospora musae TaxID=113226 RepID=A0A139I097_9PEZI|nr:hypothetical protein AC579_9209 [Pseudocercospora musae]